MSDVIFQLTEDGSHTLYLPDMDEHYHSVHGAIQESRHVYLSAGFDALSASVVSVFEVGFGTGLNALLTAIEAGKSGKSVVYTTVELHPLSIEQSQMLNYGQLLDNESLFSSIHSVEWEKLEEITSHFQLRKLKGDFSRLQMPGEEYDLIYFDAFAPNKQSDLWQQSIFDALFRSMKPGGVFVTYCAKGMVRRMLQTSGFEVERLPGPPGKHEMIRARKSFL